MYLIAYTSQMGCWQMTIEPEIDNVYTFLKSRQACGAITRIFKLDSLVEVINIDGTFQEVTKEMGE